MQCPHCLVHFHLEGTQQPSVHTAVFANKAELYYLGRDNDGYYWVEVTTCPGCERAIITLVDADDYNAPMEREPYSTPSQERPRDVAVITCRKEIRRKLVRPQSTERPPVPPEVPDEYSKDYKEACLILANSPNASAALSRRLIQLLLREKLGAPKRGLYCQIRWAIDSAGASIIRYRRARRSTKNRQSGSTPRAHWGGRNCGRGTLAGGVVLGSHRGSLRPHFRCSGA